MDNEIRLDKSVSNSLKTIKEILFLSITKFESLAKTSNFKIFIKGLISLVFIIQLLLVLLLGLIHDIHFNYDEINALNISILNIRDLLDVLSLEQNFPAYYILTHVFLKAFNNNTYILILVNYLFWLLTIITFYKILYLFTKDKRTIYLGLLIFIFLPSIYTYAIYVRMYMIYLFFFTLLFYQTVKYIQDNKITRLIISCILLSLLALLHPQSIIIIGLFVILYLFIARNIKHFFIYAFLSLIPAIILFINLSTKSRPLIPLYFTDGMEYYGQVKESLIVFPARTLIGFINDYSPIIFLIFGFSAFLFIKRKNLKLKKNFLLVFFSSFYLLLMFSLSSGLNYRHFIFLVIPLLLFILGGLSEINKRRTLYYVIVVVVFYFLNISYITKFYYNEYTHDTFCRELRMIEKGMVLLSFNNIYIFYHCTNYENITLFTIDTKGINTYVLSDNLATIKKLAITGGLTIKLPSNKGIPDLNKVKPIKSFLNEKYNIYKDIYYIRHRGSLLQGEHLLFENLVLIKTFSFEPGYQVYHFRKK